MTKVVTRFAPSPTGLMHLGNVRTALLNWLYARKLGGRFLLRFEDTDASRSEEEFVNALKQDLQWLKLDWDGEALFQSKHAGQHQDALDALAEKGLAYRCFCSETQLGLDRKLATSRGLPPRYSGKCRTLSHEESLERSQTESFVWRLPIHSQEGEVHVPDALRGDVVFARRDLDDPVVVRSDASFTFLLPNAIDDAVDGITHALRGDDHLTNSAYQVWLLEALNLNVPTYVHHGLLLGEDGAKLSKRTGSHSVAELRQEGLIPESLVQAMTRLGHPNIADDAVDIADLLAAFDVEHISRSSVKWSNDDMWRWHTRLLHHMDETSLLPLIQQHLPEANIDFVTLIRGNLERVEDALIYARLMDSDTNLNPDEKAVVEGAAEHFYETALELWLAMETADWKTWMNAVKMETGCKGKGLFMPLRVALSGAIHGPEMSSIVNFLGKEGVTERLQSVLKA
ncbi:MAG: glutamate--tRNA ligase [Mariprofundaceae bacterium]|nr:glutamate--tRNA ligase [Mariprofundaceae bacterium]